MPRRNQNIGNRIISNDRTENQNDVWRVRESFPDSVIESNGNDLEELISQLNNHNRESITRLIRSMNQNQVTKQK